MGADASAEPEKDEAERASRLPLLPLIEETRQWRERWDPILKPEGPADWFENAGTMPPFHGENAAEFDASNAWWLSELCRIAYTPDEKEAGRRWHRDKPSRHEFLEERTPFREVLNLHKTGNHVSLYRIEGQSGHVLCFRGTNKLRQWLMNLTAIPSTWERALVEEADRVCVHQGFQILFERVWPLIEPSLVEAEGLLILTGHSLGAAFATLAAAACPKPVAALVTFGSPRVGNQGFVDRLADLPIQRIVHHHDLVTLLPQREPRLRDRDFRHVGDLIYLGERPGVIHRQIGPESPSDPEWEPPNPLDFLKSSSGSTEPPEFLLDHAPAGYSEKLRALAIADRSSSGD